MANVSLTSCLPLRNDIYQLAHIFETSFHYFLNNNSPFEEDYLKGMKTIAGLGFTAVLVDDWMLPFYQKQLQIFLQYCDFKKNQGSLSLLSLSIAEMLDLASPAFRRIGSPRYYEDFTATAKKAIGHAASDVGREEKERLLGAILRKSS